MGTREIMKELLAIYNQFKANEKRALVVTTLLWTLWSLLGIAVIVITILIVREILDPVHERATIYYYWGALIGVFILKGITFSGANYIAHLAGYALVGRLRRDFVNHLKSLSLGFFTEEKLGNIATIAHNDINKIELSASHFWTKLVSDLFVSAIIAAGLFIVDWRLGLALISLLPLALLILWRASVKGAAIQKENRNNMSEMVSSFVEYTKGIPTLKTFSENPTILQRLQEKISVYGRSSKRAAVFIIKHIGGYFPLWSFALEWSLLLGLIFPG